MKKLYFLILLCTGLAFSAPDINQNPPPLYQCSGTDFAAFDLALAIPSIIGSQTGLDVSFHPTMADAQNGINELPLSYMSSQPVQTLYARVEDPSSPGDYAIATLNLIVNSSPAAAVSVPQTVVCAGNPANFVVEVSGGELPCTINYLLNGIAQTAFVTSGNSAIVPLPNNDAQTLEIQMVSIISSSGCTTELNETFEIQIVPAAIAYPVSDLVVNEAPNDGTAIFDLTLQDIPISGGNPNVTVTYFASLADAEASVPVIPNPAAYTNLANPQTIWARVASLSGECFAITSFDLVVADAQVVYFADEAFKNAVIYAGFDLNSDGEIQFSEAEAVTFMSLDNLNIADMTGIKSFANLQQLYAMDNLLTEIDLSGMPALKVVYLAGNELTSINLTGTSNLEDLVLSQNHLTGLSLQDMPNLDRFVIMYNEVTGLFLENLPQLREINVFGNGLSTLDISAFPNLQILSAANNDLVSLNLSGASNLKTVDVSSNQLTSLDVSGMANLETLNFSSNPVSEHSWDGLSNLKSLNFSNTQISNLDLPPSSSLLSLYCSGNGISALDVSAYPTLITLDCSGNELSDLDVSALTALAALNCSNNSISSLDLNANIALSSVSLSGNNMEYLFVKNGASENFGPNDFSNNNFAYICADPSQTASIQSAVGSGAEVNSFCTVEPGGIYNTITGTVRFDLNGNGCDASDSVQSFVKIRMDDQGYIYDVFTNDQAVYNLYVGNGDYGVAPVFENDYFLVSPTAASVNFASVDGSVNTNDFCVGPNGTNPDAEIAIAPIVPARPGSEAVYRITFRNKGNQVLSQVSGISLSFNSDIMDFVSATQAPSYISGGSVLWSYSNLEPFENRSIEIKFNVNAPTDSPAVNAGDLFALSVAIEAASDVAIADNSFILNQEVVDTYEPNATACLEGEIVSAGMIGEYLHYSINFANTGNATVQNIVIRDALDPTMFDRSSVVIMGSSHPVVARSGSDGLVMVFQNANVDSGGHGNILLRVRTLGNLHEGDTVSNMADIYFDYDEPISTDIFNTTFEALSVGNPPDVTVGISPNPAVDSFEVKSGSKIIAVELYDAQGRLVQAKTVGSDSCRFDMSSRQSGVYFAKVITDKGSKAEKIVKM